MYGTVAADHPDLVARPQCRPAGPDSTPPEAMPSMATSTNLPISNGGVPPAPSGGTSLEKGFGTRTITSMVRVCLSSDTSARSHVAFPSVIAVAVPGGHARRYLALGISSPKFPQPGNQGRTGIGQGNHHLDSIRGEYAPHRLPSSHDLPQIHRLVTHIAVERCKNPGPRQRQLGIGDPGFLAVKAPPWPP